MRNGKLRHTVTIQTATDPTDGSSDPDWSSLYEDVPANVHNVAGGETVFGRQIQATVNAVITHHWIDDLGPQTNRYVYDGRNCEIVATYDVHENRRLTHSQVRYLP